MKQLLCLALALIMLCSLSEAAFASEFGVQVINGPEAEEEPVSLDDIKIEEPVEVDGYGIVTVKGFDFRDKFYRYRQGKYDAESIKSGDGADFAMLNVSIINTALKSRSFARECEVKAVFDEVYEYAGWFMEAQPYKEGWYGLNEADYAPVDPLYEGFYIFGCAVPNYVVNSTKPLQLIITVDGNEIIYNIRK